MSDKQTNCRLSVRGRVFRIRDIGGIVFADIRYGSAHNTLVCRKDVLSQKDFLKMRSLKLGDFVQCICESQGGDLLTTEVAYIARSAREDFLSPSQLKIIEDYGHLLHCLRIQLKEDGYVEVRLPSIHFGHTKANFFGVDFFGNPARLSTSNSLHLSAVASHMGRAFSLQKFFRAEPSRTSKHLAEFDMLEVASLGMELEETMDYLEHLISQVIEPFLGEGTQEHRHKLSQHPSSPFKRIPYKTIDAKYHLRGRGLGRLEKEIAKEGAVFVTDFPRRLASWSARPLDKNYSRSFNLLLPHVGEVAEGNERAARTALSRKFSYLRLEDSLGWYRKGFVFPDCRLSGFGLGVERLAMWLFDLSNIRQLTPFYRDQRFSEVPCPATIPAAEKEGG